MKYTVLRCHHCGSIEAYAKGIRSRCRKCWKKLDPAKSYKIYRDDKPAPAGFVMREVKLELAREHPKFLKKAMP